MKIKNKKKKKKKESSNEEGERERETRVEKKFFVGLLGDSQSSPYLLIHLIFG